MSRVLFCVTIIFVCAISAVVPQEFFSETEDLVVPRNVTPLCLSDTEHWMAELRRGVPWALKMLDSATKLPSGSLVRSASHLGNFDQCIAVSVQDDSNSFQGHYCRSWNRVNIPGHPIDPKIMMYASCIPSSCTPDDVPDLLTNYVGPALGIDIQVLTALDPLYCYFKDSSASVSPEAIAYLVILVLLAAIILISAVLEWRLADKTPPLVRACSLTSTCRSLFNTRKHPADISCLHGLRVGSMLWIILGHRYTIERLVPLSSRDFFATFFQDPMKMTVANAMLAVDTFFLLSGFLICYSFLREMQRSHTFDVIKFYIYRYLRIAIPMIAVICFYLTVIILFGEGPLWNFYMETERVDCKMNWWTNLAFVNNVIAVEGFFGCLAQTWYTAIDMQLAWLSPLVLLPLYYSPRAGLQLMTLLILISCFIPFAVTYIFRLPMSSIQVPIEFPSTGAPGGDFITQIYMATQARATPYLCGILFSYYLFKTKDQSIQLSKTWVCIGWTCSAAVALTVIYTLAIPHQPGYVYDLVGSAFYAGFHRLGWSVALIWIIFACVKNYGGPVNHILSWKLLLPLSRLTYCAFLVHLLLILCKTATLRTLTHYSDYTAVHTFFGDLIPTYCVSFLLYVLVEGPSMALMKIAFSKGKSSAKKKAAAVLQEVSKQNVE